MPKKAGNEAAAAPPKKRAPKKQAYNRPLAIPLGEVLQDNQKTQWKVGPSIGSGGFGEIYTVCSLDRPVKKTEDYPYVLKIEPSENGPLFVEMHFYMRNAKLENINEFKKTKGLKFLGMPHFISSGTHELNNIKHRFIIMPRYGRDIWNIFLKNDRKLPISTIYRIAIEMLNVLEYIHQMGYAHGDIKGTNILLGYGKSNESQINLVDYGLAARYTTESVFKPDAKKKHNGTIEYTSRDSHDGVITRRGDLEILGYNLIQWNGVSLPWETQNLLDKPQKVQELKETYMKNVDNFLKKCFPNDIPEAIHKFMIYVAKMKFNEVPDYTACRKLFEKGLKDMKKTVSGPLELTVGDEPSKTTMKSPAPKVKASPKKKRVANGDSSSGSSVSPTKRPKKKLVDIEYEMNNTNDSIDQPSGSIILNNNARANGKAKKKYEFNFELDVSVDADVVVNVNRKRASRSKKSEPDVSVISNSSIENLSLSTEEEDEPEVKPKSRTAKPRAKAPAKATAVKAEPKIKAVARAGEYKGKKAK